MSKAAKDDGFGFSDSSPRVDFEKLKDFYAAKPPERNVAGGPAYTKWTQWLAWAVAYTGHPGLAEMQTNLHDLKAGHGGWDRDKDIELVQAHSDVSYTSTTTEGKRGEE